MTPTVRARDLEPADFPFTIVVHRESWVWDSDDGWLWAVTVLRPPPGTRVPLYVPGQDEPAWVSTLTGEGVEATTGPYEMEMP
jgi:hypothetical protein